MSTETYILIALLVIGVTYACMRIAFAMRYHGEMLITCPETMKPAAVKVSLARAALASITGRMLVRLSDCSRWPQRAGCDQGCVVQLERDPKNHRVWAVASHWFADKKCAYCGKTIEPFHHYNRRPGVVDAQKITTEWDEIPPEQLPDTFAASRPVCWSCHMTQKFVREHPDLVTVRPWQKDGPIGEYVPEKHSESEVHHVSHS